MTRIRVSLIGELYDCVKPLFDETIRPEGVELVVTRSPSPEAMRRQLTAWEFDICEMAFGAYLIARAQGADVTAIPVFPRRAFFHTNSPTPSPKAGVFTTRTAMFPQTTPIWFVAVLPASTRRSSSIFIRRSGNRRPARNSRCLVQDRRACCSETNRLRGRANR